MIAHSCHKLFLADSLSQSSFLRQHSEHIVPEPLQTHHSVYRFYTTYAVLRLLKFRKEKINGVLDNNLRLFISNYMQCIILFNMHAQITQCVCSYLYTLI